MASLVIMFPKDTKGTWYEVPGIHRVVGMSFAGCRIGWPMLVCLDDQLRTRYYGSSTVVESVPSTWYLVLTVFVVGIDCPIVRLAALPHIP